MKFLVYTDSHFAIKTPVHRVDENYSATLLEKLKEIYQTAENNDCECVLFLGDFYNSHRIYSYDLINDIIEIIDSTELKTYSLVGQHDLAGYNMDTYSTSALCFTERHCKNLHTMWGPTKLGEKVICYPCHAYDDFNKALASPVLETDFNILAAHKLITMTKAVYETYVISDFCPCVYDLIIFGDLHTGLEVTKYEGNTIWSPGALARQAISEVKRKVRIGIVEVEGKECEINEIFLKSAKPAEEVFQVRHIENIRKRTQLNDSDGFIERIQGIEMESVDIFDLLDKVAREKKVKKEVINLILSKKS